MRVLVISDDTWHPAEVIEMGLAPLNGKFDMTYIRTAKDILTPEYLRGFDVAVVCKGDCINGGNHEPWFEEGVTEVLPQDFKRYVEGGGGFIALHAGNCFREGDSMTELTGNYFIGHPPRCQVSLRFERTPLTEGAEDFTERDEHYQIAVAAGDAAPFAYSVSETGGRRRAIPGCWAGAGWECILRGTRWPCFPTLLRKRYWKTLLYGQAEKGR